MHDSSTSVVGRPVFFISIIVIILVIGPIFGFAYYNLQDPYIHGNGTVAQDKVQEIDLTWEDGDVTIQFTDTDIITLTEYGAEKSSHMMMYRVHNGVLTVKYSQPVLIRLGSGDIPQKHLVMTFPDDPEAISALRIRGKSSRFYVENGTIKTLSVEQETSACHILYDGTLEEVYNYAASADFTGTFHSAPKLLNVTSGPKYEFTFPEGVGFRINGSRGKYIQSDYDLERGFLEGEPSAIRQADYHYYGNCQVEINIANNKSTQMYIYAPKQKDT